MRHTVKTFSINPDTDEHTSDHIGDYDSFEEAVRHAEHIRDVLIAEPTPETHDVSVLDEDGNILWQERVYYDGSPE